MAADSLPLVNLFLPSFLSSVDKATRKFRYTLYLGFDLEDVVYDDKRKLEQVRKRMVTMIGDYPVQVKAVRAFHPPVMAHWPLASGAATLSFPSLSCLGVSARVRRAPEDIPRAGMEVVMGRTQPYSVYCTRHQAIRPSRLSISRKRDWQTYTTSRHGCVSAADEVSRGTQHHAGVERTVRAGNDGRGVVLPHVSRRHGVLPYDVQVLVRCARGCVSTAHAPSAHPRPSTLCGFLNLILIAAFTRVKADGPPRRRTLCLKYDQLTEPQDALLTTRLNTHPSAPIRSICIVVKSKATGVGHVFGFCR